MQHRKKISNSTSLSHTGSLLSEPSSSWCDLFTAAQNAIRRWWNKTEVIERATGTELHVLYYQSLFWFPGLTATLKTFLWYVQLSKSGQKLQEVTMKLTQDVQQAELYYIRSCFMGLGGYKSSWKHSSVEERCAQDCEKVCAAGR